MVTTIGCLSLSVWCAIAGASSGVGGISLSPIRSMPSLTPVASTATRGRTRRQRQRQARETSQSQSQPLANNASESTSSTANTNTTANESSRRRGGLTNDLRQQLRKAIQQIIIDSAGDINENAAASADADSGSGSGGGGDANANANANANAKTGVVNDQADDENLWSLGKRIVTRQTVQIAEASSQQCSALAFSFAFSYAFSCAFACAFACAFLLA